MFDVCTRSNRSEIVGRPKEKKHKIDIFDRVRCSMFDVRWHLFVHGRSYTGSEIVERSKEKKFM